MIQWIKANQKNLAGGLVLLLGIGGYFAYDYFTEEEEASLTDELAWLGQGNDDLGQNVEGEEMKEEEPTVILVDVKGAIVRPGVYEAEENERIMDLIQKAGGLTEEADSLHINFAGRVSDEMVIYVPVIGEEVSEGFSPSHVGKETKDDGKVNVNTATQAELETLPGIGPAKAAAIMEYREENGPFKAIEDIKQISGIGAKTFEKLQDRIKVK